MHIIWDNLTAMLLLMVVTFTLLVVTSNTQQTLAESTAYYMLRNEAIAFQELLKRDLKGIEEVNSYSAAGGSFRFVTHIGDDNTSYNIEYRRKAVAQTERTVRDKDGTSVETVTVYKIERYVNGSLAGGSTASITMFDIQALNEQNEPLKGGDDLGGSRKLRLRLEAASPYVDNDVVDRLRWETIYAPPLLSESEII